MQIRRSIRRKNEWTHLTFVPAATGGVTSIFRASAAATLVGLDLPPASQEHRAQALWRSRSSRPTGCARRAGQQRPRRRLPGCDAKYGINANLTADLTINTDFAQVEVDEQQVNLTRFPRGVPREARLLPRGARHVRIRARVRAGRLQRPDQHQPTSAPQLFFTPAHRPQQRRARCRSSPAAASPARWARPRSASMNMETGYESPADVDQDACAPPYAACTPRTNFTVLRVRHDILRRSTIGAIFTNRVDSPTVRRRQPGLRHGRPRSRSSRTSPPTATTRAASR